MKLLHKHACFGFFQKPIVVQPLCLLTSPISSSMIQKCVLCSEVLSAVRNMREKHCFLKPRMKNSAELYAWQSMGAHSMQNLNIIINLHERLRLYFVRSGFIFHFFYFPDLKLPHVFKRWQNKVPSNTLSVKGLHCCCCIFPQKVLLYPQW